MPNIKKKPRNKTHKSKSKLANCKHDVQFVGKSMQQAPRNKQTLNIKSISNIFKTLMGQIQLPIKGHSTGYGYTQNVYIRHIRRWCMLPDIQNLKISRYGFITRDIYISGQHWLLPNQPRYQATQMHKVGYGLVSRSFPGLLNQFNVVALKLFLGLSLISKPNFHPFVHTPPLPQLTYQKQLVIEMDYGLIQVASCRGTTNHISKNLCCIF